MPPDPTAIQPDPSQQPQQGGGGGFFSKIGAALHNIGPYIVPAANRLAAAAGNYGPLEEEHRQTQLQLQRANLQREQQLSQAQIENEGLRAQLTQKQIENTRSPEEQEALKPPAQFTGVDPNTNQPVVYQRSFDAATKSYVNKPTTVAGQVPNPEYQQFEDVQSGKTPPPNYVQDWNAPPTMPKTIPGQVPIAAPSQIGFHIQGLDSNGNPIVEEYSKTGAPIGTQAAPLNPNAGLLPGVGKVSPMDVGAAGAPMPTPNNYPGGARSPQFQSDYQAWLKTASAAKQANSIAQAGARGAAFNATRPIQAYDPGLGESVVTTMGRQDKQNPGQPILSANQAGAANVAGKRATFAEVDQNLQNFRDALPAVNTLTPRDRAAIVSGFNPATSTLGRVGQAGIEGLGFGLGSLSPEKRALVDTARNLRQGVTSLRNVLSSAGGASDYRINLLESEMPNEQDFAGSSAQQISNKLAKFESIYKDIIASYPQVFGGTGGAQQQSSPRQSLTSEKSPASAPPVNPPVPGQPKVLVEGRDF